MSANLPDPSPSDATPDAWRLLPTDLLRSERCAGPDTSEFIEILDR
jgi:hypothetical protein